MLLRCRPRLGLPRNVFNAAPSRIRQNSNLADKYHPKVSVLPFTNDVASTQAKLDMLVPPMFGLLPAILGYAQMAFGREVIDSGIKRTEFKPVYVPTWVIDSVATFTSRIAANDQDTTMHFCEGILPGLHHHPLSRWVARFEVADIAKPFSKEHLEPLEGKHEIVSLPYTTSPLAIPQALSKCSYDDMEVAEGWDVDLTSVDVKMLAAYPVLQPVYLSEFTMGDRHITVLAHGHHDYFSVWGHANHPDTWVNNSQSSVIITYLRTLAMELNGGPSAMAGLITEANTPDNLEKIVQEVDMNDLRIQPVSSANATRHWMELAGKADGMKFIIDNIPPNGKTTVINTATGDRIVQSGKQDARAPLQRQLKEIEAEMEATKPDWLAKWDESTGGTAKEKPTPE